MIIFKQKNGVFLLNKISNKNYLKKIIKEYAYSIGFNKVGFAKYRVLDEEIRNYQNWISNGFHASMSYLERNIHKRYDLKQILPEVESVIVFAHSYFTRIEHKSPFAKISRYAWGDDYHEILEKKLKLIVGYISQHVPNLKCKIYVDTGPLLEKIWAVESGIGWQGKNSLVLSKELGSYFFIGIILTNIEFEADTKVRDHCGSCVRCLQACPTGAIVQPKVIDSRKCISFWTIEKKTWEEIPEDLNFKGWVFGCDICQEVCPWNSKAVMTNESKFLPRDSRTNLDEKTFEGLTPEVFKEKFRKSPVKRAKFEGIVKNYKHILRQRCAKID